MRVLRVYHAGRDTAHRARDRALVAAGGEVTLVVPRSWPGPDDLHAEPFEVIELAVSRAGDVNRHRWLGDLAAVVARVQPDLLDLHNEPVSVAARQWLTAAGDRPVVMYSAQNLDKRWPPPFAQAERAALRRVAGMYPCSRQAASVLRGKGYAGTLAVLPLGTDPALHRPGGRTGPVTGLLLAGRLVPEKGVLDAVRLLAAVPGVHLTIVGSGPQEQPARDLAEALGVADRLRWSGWVDAAGLAAAYRAAHVVLLTSRTTATWVEQFGRVVTEGRACGAVTLGYASGSLPEVVASAGVLVGEGDEAALAVALQALVDAPERWKALSDKGIALAKTHTWAAVAAGTIALYEQALGPARPVAVGRTAAVAEFGRPSRTTLSERPFALPVLRGSRLAHRLVGDRGPHRSASTDR